MASIAAPASVPAQAPSKKDDLTTTLKKAGERALGGGIAGFSAMFIQVLSLMWMRTIMNYQYRHGSSLKDAAKTLYKEGGIPRFYKGLLPALVQGPLSRFGDTASNAGMLALLNSNPTTENLPIVAKTACASAAAGGMRIILLPVDTVKTILQVEGSKGLPMLMNKFRTHGPSVFFHGALAASAATFAGHLPWFATHNKLDSMLPKYHDDKLKKLARNAGIGFCSSVVSDTISNSIRVIKTYRQTHAEKISYPQAIKEVVQKDGYLGLFGRGLKTRLLANGTQGLMFSVLWKYFDEKFAKKPVQDAKKL